MARRDGESGTAVLDRDTLDAPENGTGALEGDASGQDASGTGEGAGVAPDGATAGSGRAKRTKRDPSAMGPEEIISLNVRIPNALRSLVAKTAEEQQTSVPQLVANMLASAYAFELPKPARTARVKKYANPEERKQAAKDAQAKQRAITRAVLKAVEEGKVNLDIDALVAQLKADEEAKAAAAAPATPVEGTAS